MGVKHNLSVAVIARDAAKMLPRCLESVKEVADDIVVVVDPRTTDRTAEIARKHGARIFYHHFDNFAAQKNFAVSKAKGDWILSVDADEWLEDELIKEIENIRDWEYGGFYIRRKNIIFGKVMNYTNWEPQADKHIWLYNKKMGKWVGEVHEEVVVSGSVGRLQNYKIHHSYKTVEEFITKMNGYTSQESKVTNPIYDFLRRYLWHKGFLDGWHGLFLSYLMMIYHLSTRIKLWEKKNLSL